MANQLHAAYAAYQLQLSSTDTVIYYPKADDDGVEMRPRLEYLAACLAKYPEAGAALMDMEQSAVVYLESAEEEFHIARTGEGFQVLDHFTSHVRPGGNGLILYLSDDACTISHVLQDRRLALEEKLGKSLDLSAIQAASIGNQPFIEPDTACGCFSCKRIFKGEEIKEYTLDVLGAKSAYCPHCGMDTVIGNGNLPDGLSVTNELINLMSEFYFGETVEE